MSAQEPLPPHLEILGRQLVAAAVSLKKSQAISPRRSLQRWSFRRPLTRVRVAVVLGLLAALFAVAALAPNVDKHGGPTSAFAAPLMHFAQASPRILMPLPGWQVVDANEQSSDTGEIDFVKGPTTPASQILDVPAGTSPYRPASIADRVASLTWSPLTSLDRQDLMAAGESIPTGLGVNVTQLVTEGSGNDFIDISGFMEYDSLVLRFRATVTSMVQFRAELLALHSVDVNTFLTAMPANVITAINATGDASQTIREMLSGIPLPPGFTAAKIKGAGLIRDRYQLGAAVTGTVACMWIGDWNRARVDGDTSMVNRAITAMATSSHWPVLIQMAKQGGWTQALTAFAAAMPNGTSYGRPLAGDVKSGLGCQQLGVSLGPLPQQASQTATNTSPAGPPLRSTNN